MTLIGVTGTLVILSRFCAGGENLISPSVEFYNTLCDTDWIHWNRSNKRTLLIMLQITSTPLAISFFGIISLDFNLLKQFYKWSYQAISLIVQFQHK
ncbi:uncharacterized protein LOC130447960 isoform X2 [Diorhabda sublineata]|uniref:uncharacterized protein LOC130447960 isoform X2 n=1 Tax=Diorhabda sublineata TaxID=1163346 RepID=UPI0024E048C5|nr:uncharacterized protein LOC130447960 isoform X2 [Diorhabda sublineata]